MRPVLPLLSLLLLPTLANAGAPDREDPLIFGGELNGPCEWPSAVNLVFGGSGGNCTGTLVHPQVILTARHCGAGGAKVNFGEDPENPAFTTTASCTTMPTFEDFQEDAMFCILEEPVDQFPIIPVLYGCETELLQPEAPVVITGYGRDENGKRGPKKVAQTQLIEVQDKYVELGHWGTSPCHGDSGGPAFIQLADGSWRAFGIVHGRYDIDPFNPPPMICGEWAAYVRMDSIVEWVEQESGFDITPCHDADGTWNPGPDCGGFPVDTSGVGMDWASWCVGGEASGFSNSCGDPYDDGSGGDGEGDGDGDGDGDDGGEDDGGTSDSGDDSGGDGPMGTDELDPSDDAEGCGCHSGSNTDALTGTLGLLALLGLRRSRRRRRATAPTPRGEIGSTSAPRGAAPPRTT